MRKLIGCFFILLISFTNSYAQSGQLDPSFGSLGRLFIGPYKGNIPGLQSAMAIQPDGKIILIGSTYNSSTSRGYDFVIMRLQPNGGKLDPSFGDEGQIVIDYKLDQEPFPVFTDIATDVAIAPDGKILVVGGSSRPRDGRTEAYIMVFRFNADGSRDASFDGDGMKVIDLVPGYTGYENAEAVSILFDGKILIAGRAAKTHELDPPSDMVVIKLKADGQQDESFGSNGISFIDVGRGDVLYDMVVQPNGNIVLGGGAFNYNNYSNIYDFALVRLMHDGKPDPSFSDDGILTFDMGSSYEWVNSIAIQGDEKIVVTGYYSLGLDPSNIDLPVARFNKDGSFDLSFDMDGKKIIGEPRLHELGVAVIVDDRDHILLGMTAETNEAKKNTDFAVIKLTPEGKLDVRFDRIDFFGRYDNLGSMEFQSDGKIVLAGTSYTDGNESSFAVARIFNVTEVEPTLPRVTYIGPKILGTPCFGCQTAIIPLRATIQDPSAPGPPGSASDPYPGDIRNARVKFVDRDNNVDITGWIPVTKLIDSNNTKTATVDATWYVTLSYDQPVKKVRVGIVVDNRYYLRNDSRDDATITLYMPQDDVVSGGAEFFSPTSIGKYKAVASSVTIIGFYAQLKKGMPQPSGYLNMWFSGTNETGNRTTYLLEIKSINGLGVNNSQALPKHAEFHGTGKLWDRSGATPVLVEDNVTVQTRMVDGGDRHQDSLTVNVWSNNNVLLHSSNWSYTKPTPRSLFYGNVTVHSGSSLDENPSSLMTKSLIENQKENVSQKDLTVTILNNPTRFQFSLHVLSPYTDVYSLIIKDMAGRIIEARSNLPVSNVLQIGSNYKAGVYFAEIRQGKNVRVVKMVKN